MDDGNLVVQQKDLYYVFPSGERWELCLVLFFLCDKKKRKSKRARGRASKTSHGRILITLFFNFCFVPVAVMKTVVPK